MFECVHAYVIVCVCVWVVQCGRTGALFEMPCVVSPKSPFCDLALNPNHNHRDGRN